MFERPQAVLLNSSKFISFYTLQKACKKSLAKLVHLSIYVSEVPCQCILMHYYAAFYCCDSTGMWINSLPSFKDQKRLLPMTFLAFCGDGCTICYSTRLQSCTLQWWHHAKCIFPQMSLDLSSKNSHSILIISFPTILFRKVHFGLQQSICLDRQKKPSNIGVPSFQCFSIAQLCMTELWMLRLMSTSFCFNIHCKVCTWHPGNQGPMDCGETQVRLLVISLVWCKCDVIMSLINLVSSIHWKLAIIGAYTTI